MNSAPAEELEGPAPVELTVPDHDWTFSTYTLENGLVHFEHPNNLGVTHDNGLPTESARCARFRQPYISKEMVRIYRRRSRFVTRLTCRQSDPDISAVAEGKMCFRRDEFTAEQPVSSPVPTGTGDIPDMVRGSRAALADATRYFGPELLSDMEKGFSRAFAADEEVPFLPSVEEAAGTLEGQGDEETLSLVVSYRHATKKQGYILNLDTAAWTPLHADVCALCRRAGCRKFRLWTDQILSFRKPRATLRWVSSGIFPYMVYPVYYVLSPDVHADLARMWISIEHLSACFGQGLIHAGGPVAGQTAPKEWVQTYVHMEEGCRSLTWMTGLKNEMYQVVRRVCGVIMCGLLRNKALSWPLDGQDIIEWASTITVSAMSPDLEHTFTCEDCERPAGYPSLSRLAGLISSASPIFPQRAEGHSFSDTHPRPNVPALRLEIDGRSWDGFREWVPESCLWGAAEDNRRDEAVRKGSKGIIVSEDGNRSVGVLQWEYRQGEGIIVAYLLVGLVREEGAKGREKAVWSKRFWPVDPIKMWRAFRQLYANTRDTEALFAMAIIVGASSGLDYTNISDAQEVRTVKLAKVKW
ncbi:unnamed protein product [Chondrus crispus]|uniref:Uncharacterized protein n=1 Tax=Chondrus crispus TaxID=2769 RepID=R7QTD6_CHOCR|nr:unnamed protein product [Chondrus crispus]CDF40968.1 unnamed protein product [Chondrus crispus]|eukprot:XP_005711262.1 unnamed protein product [Chondrus crispus]